MKKVILSLTAALVGLGLQAQDAKTAFYPGWYLGIQAGGAYTTGETSFKDLSSFNSSINLGYQFTPAFALRGDVSGFTAKGYATLPRVLYSFNYVQGNIDAVFDICNIFKYKYNRTLNPYVFAGIGLNHRFNNDDALAIDNYFKSGYCWENPTLSFTSRIGAGLAIRCSDAVAITLEVQDNALSDKFNSKDGNMSPDFDYQLAGLVGVKFNFGGAKRKAIAMEEEMERAKAAAAEAERVAAAKAAAEKAAAEKAAAKAAAEKAAKERAAAEKAAKEAARAREAKEAAERAMTVTLTFFTEKSFILEHQKPWVDKVIEHMNAYPKAVVTIKGYADKKTGEHGFNMDLSERRANTVAKYMTKRGIDPSRITVEFYGDTVTISEINKKNRAAVIEVK